MCLNAGRRQPAEWMSVYGCVYVCVCARTNAALIFLGFFFVFPGRSVRLVCARETEGLVTRARAMCIRDGIICCWNHTNILYSICIYVYVGCMRGIEAAGVPAAPRYRVLLHINIGIRMRPLSAQGNIWIV